MIDGIAPANDQGWLAEWMSEQFLHPVTFWDYDVREYQMRLFCWKLYVLYWHLEVVSKLVKVWKTELAV